MSPSRRQPRLTWTRRSRWTLAPSSASRAARAALPISPTLAPFLPIRIRFCDSVSAQISAGTVTRPSSRGRDLPDPDLDRMRDLLPGAVEDLLADQLGQQQLARIGRCAPRSGRGTGPPGSAPPAARSAPSSPSPGLALIGKTSSTPSISAASGSTGTSSFGPSLSALLTAQITGSSAPAPSRARAMKRSPGPNALLAVDHDQRQVRFGQLALDPVLHALGEDVAGPLHAGQVDDDELAASLGVRGDPADRPPRRLRPHRDDRHVAADDRVDERRLARVGPPGEPDKTGARRRGAHRSALHHPLLEGQGGVSSCFRCPELRVRAGRGGAS